MATTRAGYSCCTNRHVGAAFPFHDATGKHAGRPQSIEPDPTVQRAGRSQVAGQQLPLAPSADGLDRLARADVSALALAGIAVGEWPRFCGRPSPRLPSTAYRSCPILSASAASPTGGTTTPLQWHVAIPARPPPDGHSTGSRAPRAATRAAGAAQRPRHRRPARCASYPGGTPSGLQRSDAVPARTVHTRRSGRLQGCKAAACSGPPPAGAAAGANISQPSGACAGVALRLRIL